MRDADLAAQAANMTKTQTLVQTGTAAPAEATAAVASPYLAGGLRFSLPGSGRRRARQFPATSIETLGTHALYLTTCVAAPSWRL